MGPHVLVPCHSWCSAYNGDIAEPQFATGMDALSVHKVGAIYPSFSWFIGSWEVLWGKNKGTKRSQVLLYLFYALPNLTDRNTEESFHSYTVVLIKSLNLLLHSSFLQKKKKKSKNCFYDIYNIYAIAMIYFLEIAFCFSSLIENVFFRLCLKMGILVQWLFYLGCLCARGTSTPWFDLRY